MQLLDPFAHLSLRNLLLRHVERRGHPVAAPAHGRLVAPEDLRELVADLEDEVRRADGGHRWARDLDPLRARGLGLLLRDRADIHHLVEHVAATLLGAIDVLGLRRVEHRRSLRETGEKRRFRQRELRQVGLPEIGLRGRLYAVCLVPVIDLVEVELEDLLLRVGPRDLDREDGLTDLPLDAHLATDDPLLHELLRDRRCAALAGAAIRDIGVDRAEDPQDVQAGVRPEALVFGRHGGVDEHLRDVFVRRDLAALFLELVEQLGAGAVVELRGLGERIAREVLGGGQVLGQAGERDAAGDDQEGAGREEEGEQARGDEEAQTAERSAAPEPLRAIRPAAERVVVGPSRARDDAMLTGATLFCERADATFAASAR